MADHRAPLDPSLLTRALAGSFVTTLEVVAETTSTNNDLAAAARDGAAHGSVRVAEFQSAGRGRFSRAWSSPPCAGLTFSILLRPSAVPVSQWGWVPLLTGVALADAVTELLPGLDARLKWPNDLLLGPSGLKVAGILAEAGAGWIVVGIGVNVDTTRTELPSAQAVSLRLAAGTPIDRGRLLVATVVAFGARYEAWVAAAGDPERSGLRAAYEAACDTLGREVEIQRPDRRDTARAVGVDGSGALVVETDAGRSIVSAGDIAHIRRSGR